MTSLTSGRFQPPLSLTEGNTVDFVFRLSNNGVLFTPPLTPVWIFGIKDANTPSGDFLIQVNSATAASGVYTFVVELASAELQAWLATATSQSYAAIQITDSANDIATAPLLCQIAPNQNDTGTTPTSANGTLNVTAGKTVTFPQSLTFPSALGTNGFQLTTDGAGALTWAAGTNAPGGSTTQVQYNNAGSFAGITGATTNGTALTLVAPVLGEATATSINGITLTGGPLAGTIDISGDISLSGGSINTSCISGNFAGGSINTSSDQALGGSINTSEGGGSITTNGNGSIGLGIVANRTYLVSTAGNNEKTATFPNVTGTVVVAATSATDTQALFATATAGAPAYRAIATADIATALETPGAIGGTTASTGAFTTISGRSTLTLGVNTVAGGSLVLRGLASGSATISTSSAGVLALPSGTTATSMALTTPVILQINDATGNETLKLASIASAVNEVTIENAATGSAVHISATGGDASVGLHLAGKGPSGYVNVQDSIDATKRILFNASGGTTSTRTMLSSTQTIDRTITLPDAAGTVVLNTSGNLAAPGAIGGTTASTGAFTTLTSSNTTDSTTTATGAIQTLGGLGVAKSIFAGGNVNIPATTSTVGQIKQAGSVIFHTKSGTAGAGNGSVYLGISSGLVTNTAENNVGVGAFALSSTNASLNAGVGYCAMQHNVTGTENVALGSFALRNGTASTFNVAIGTRALNVCNGAQNLAVGYESLQLLTSGSNNTGFGFQSGYYATGSNNVFVGASAGNILNEAGSNNTFIGAAAVPNGTAYTFCTALGAGATATADNQVMLGRAADIVTLPGGLVTVPIAQTATTAAVSVAVTTTALTTTAPAQAITLANGTNGQIKIVTHIASSGAGTAVLTPATSAADYNTITFSSVGDTATLQYHTTGGWYILSLRGAVAA